MICEWLIEEIYFTGVSISLYVLSHTATPSAFIRGM
jgi:hypothetical protein